MFRYVGMFRLRGRGPSAQHDSGSCHPEWSAAESRDLDGALCKPLRTATANITPCRDVSTAGQSPSARHDMLFCHPELVEGSRRSTMRTITNRNDGCSGRSRPFDYGLRPPLKVTFFCHSERSRGISTLHGAHRSETARHRIPDKSGVLRRQSAATPGEGLQ